MATLSKLVNYHIEELKRMENLSERTKNVCIEGMLDTLYKILYYYLERNTFRDIRSCGLKTDMELVSMSKKYLAQSGLTLEELRMNEYILGFEDFKLFCFLNFTIPSDVTESFKEDFLRKDFPAFRYINIMFEYVLNNREKYILDNNFGFRRHSQKHTLQAIGDQYSITRERVRQILQKVPFKVQQAIVKTTQRFTTLENNFDYGLDLKKEIIMIDQSFAEQINLKEVLDFTPKLYAYLLAALFNRYFISIQDLETTYNHYYLISKKYEDIFDFKALIADVELLNKQRITTDYTVDAHEYLSRFILPGQALNDRLKQICKRILMEEFSMESDKTNLVFKRNSLVKLSEHIVNILRENRKPMKLAEINKELKLRSKRIPPNIESLRSSILSIDEIAAIGKTSTYILKEWQNIKTGTIKELVKEYLEMSGEPKHIADITRYINKFRVTSEKNILSNLKLDKTNTFAFFKLGFIGLKYRQYKNIQVNSNIRKRPPHNNSNDGQLKLL